MAECAALRPLGEAMEEFARVPANHLARVAGLALLDESRAEVFSDAALGITNVRSVGEGDALFSVHFHRPGAAISLAAGGGWDPAWSSSDACRIVVAALDESHVAAAGRELTRLGRAVTFREPCASYELPSGDAWDSLCGCQPEGLGGHPEWADPAVELDTSAVSAHYGLPPGLRLRTLRDDDAEVVNDTWKYKTAKSIEMVRKGIATRPTAALGLEAEGGRAVAWITGRYDGSVGLLHTLPECRGKGYAKAVVRFACLQIRRWRSALLAKAGTGTGAQTPPAPLLRAVALAAQPYCHIKLGNVQSEAVFKGLGFVEVNRVTWVLSSALAPRVRLRAMAPPSPQASPSSLDAEGELADLLALVNTSYRQDDAFFVDQTRTDVPTLRKMMETGVFYVGYRMGTTEADAAGVGLGTDLCSDLAAPAASASASAGGGGEGSGVRRWGSQAEVPEWAWRAHPAELGGEGRELLVSVYVSLSDSAAEGSGAKGGGASGAGAGAGAGDVGCAGGAGSVPTASSASSSVTTTAQLSMLTVLPSLKRLGMGQRVLDFALAECGRLGAGRVEAFVVSVKPWLQSFYRDRNGFREVGTERWPPEQDHQLLMPCHFHVMRKDIA